MKDYASRSFSYSESREPGKAVPIHWRFIIAALVAMLLIYSVSKHVQQRSLIQAAPGAVPAPVSNKAQLAAATPPVPSTTASAVKPAPVSAPVKFDFYQTLTESPSKAAKVAATPDDQSTAANTSAATTNSRPTVQASASATSVEKASRYYLEVGSYKTKAEALQQKANLILSEISPKLIKVSGGNGRYRVLVGPYSNLSLATAERSDLRQSGINGSLIKASDLKK